MGYNAVSCIQSCLVKELDSHAKHGQRFKNKFGRITEYFCAKNFFLITALHDVNEGGTTCMGISPRGTRMCTHRPERERAHQHASFGCTARDSLRKNVSKEVCFWLYRKDNLVQLPEEPSVT